MQGPRARTTGMFASGPATGHTWRAVMFGGVIALVGSLLVAAPTPALSQQSGQQSGQHAGQESGRDDTGPVPDGDPSTTERLFGGDPTAVALAASKNRFAAANRPGRHAAHVVLSRNDNFADSLAASALTGEGPLLFTDSDRLTTDTAGEMDRVLPGDGLVYVLGGPNAISPDIVRRLRDAGYRVTRLAGATRVETAVAVAEEVRRVSTSNRVLLARAYAPEGNPTAAWADAVSAGAVAAAEHSPILVTPTDRLHPAVAAWLDADDPRQTIVLGGRGAVSQAVAREVPNPRRIAGTDRTRTAAKIATRVWHADDDGARGFTVVPGERFDGWAYGLAAAGLAADHHAPVLMVRHDGISTATRRFVSNCGGSEVELMLAGDGSVISGPLREQLEALDGEACRSGGEVRRTARLSAPSCEDTLATLKERARERVGPVGLHGGRLVSGEPVPSDVDDATGAGQADSGSAAEASAPQPPESSGTNVQEPGVDEPDLVDTDGEVALAVANNHLQVVDLTGGAPRLAAALDLPDSASHELVQNGDRVLVFTRAFTQPEPSGSDSGASSEAFRAGAPQTILTLVDITDPATPQVVSRLHVDGNYRSARAVDGVARVVVQDQPTLDFTAPENDTPHAIRDAAEANREIVDAAEASGFLPGYRRTDGDGNTRSNGQLVECDDVRLPPWGSGLGTVSVFSVDLSGDLEPGEGAAVAADAETVYASTGTLYVATGRWGPAEPALRDVDVRTEIHAFDITDPAATDYVASGAVSGYLLNQFSLSEYEERLRVATTSSAPWGTPDDSESSVAVFRRDGDELVEVGRVDGLGEGQRITGVRFLGDIGYVVTFRRIDPLYTIDLADPTAPRVLGELKIDGFSAYLHPIGDDRLLGVGSAADADGRVTGAQVSLFDVSDLSNPTRVDNVVFPDADSEVAHDHHAFLHWPPTGLSVLPLQKFEPEQDRLTSFAAGVRVDGDRLREIGRVSHQRDGDTDRTAHDSRVRRSFVVGDRLYTMSRRGLQQAALDTLEAQSFVSFEGD